MKKILFFAVVCLLSLPVANAMSLIGRLGIGMSQQVVSGHDTISFKIQRDRAMALGGLIGINSSQENSTYALGGKLYRIIYDEPQLNFYTAGLLAFFTYPNSDDEIKSGYQAEALFGTEFSFQGLESVGWSFEFGAGLQQYDGRNSFQTIGHNVIKSAIHFYL